MPALRRFLACALLCLGFALPVVVHAQDEMGATPDESASAPVDTTTPEAKPDKALPAKDLPPAVGDVPLPPPPPAGTMEDEPIAELQALDKITARVSHIEAHVGETIGFGSLTITVKACRSAPPEDPPESAAFLEIVEQKPNEKPAMLYSGWMFASSPALAAMDHPIYDIWVTECRKDSVTPAAASPAVK